MELICASPCVTTLICMSMEARHRHESGPLDERAHMPRHRLGARGNALTFPMPWEDLLQSLQGQLDGELGSPQLLPRSGKQLSEVVRVILKTNKKGETTTADIKTLIHQANVRREARVGKLSRRPILLRKLTQHVLCVRRRSW